MQTFLPEADYATSAKILDNKRLGKQRVEAYQMLRALRGDTKGWVHHPATKMWRDNEYELALYGLTMSIEFIERGFDGYKMVEIFNDELVRYADQNKEKYPWFVTFEPLLTSHRSNLYRKDPIHYSRYAHIGSDLPYVWCNPDGTWKFGK